MEPGIQLSKAQKEEKAKAEEADMKRRVAEFQNELVLLEKKYNLKQVLILNPNIVNGIKPGIVYVDPTKHPEYQSPKAFEEKK